MNVLLVWPGITLPGFNSLKTSHGNEATYISHGYMAISAELKKRGHTVQLIDMRDTVGWDQFEQVLRDNPYDIAALGFMSCDLGTSTRVTAFLKTVWPDQPVVVGGLHLTLTGEKTFPNADCVIAGEADLSFADLVDGYAAGGDIPPYIDSSPIDDLDVLELEDRNLFDDEPERSSPLLPGLPAPNVTIIQSRGCNFRCKFCAPSGAGSFGKKLRLRSLDRVIYELTREDQTRGIGSVMFHSDLTAGRKYLEEMIEVYGSNFEGVPFWCQIRADSICRNKDLMPEMARVGLLWASVGFESGSPRMLELLDKKASVEENIQAAEILHQCGVNLFANTLVGVPGETVEDMQATLRMMEQIKPAWHSCNAFASFPGSALFDHVTEKGLLTDEHFSRAVFPWQRKIQGIDYDAAFKIQDEIRRHTRPVSQPKTTGKFGGSRYAQAPDVSIIMRSFNRREMIETAINSIRAQTHKSWELIIVDDASSDTDLIEYLQGLEDENIKVILNDKNADGHSIRLNQGILASKGALVGFCDDDDTRDPTWLEKMVHQLEHHQDWGFVICKSTEIVFGNPRVVRGIRPKLPNILSGNTVDLGELVIRRGVFDQIGLFDERIHHGDDWEFVSRLIKGDIPGDALGEALCTHNVHQGGQNFTRTPEQLSDTAHIIRERAVSVPIRIACFWPEEGKLQGSQMEVVTGVYDALVRIKHVRVVGFGEIAHCNDVTGSADVIFVVCPFQATHSELTRLQQMGVPMAAILTEDPPALNSNLANSIFFTWIITNDMSCIEHYQTRADKRDVPYCRERVGYMPCLSVNTAVVGSSPKPRAEKEKWDMAIVGYMYDSRDEWFAKVQKDIDFNLLLVGRRWEKYEKKFEVLGDQTPAATNEIYANTKIIACIHRLTSDDGTKVVFRSTSRGFRETWSGAMVMIDDTREIFPPFIEGEVVSFEYNNPKDFLDKAHHYLDHDHDRRMIGRMGQRKAQENFTYVHRFTCLIRDMISPKMEIRVP